MGMGMGMDEGCMLAMWRRVCKLFRKYKLKRDHEQVQTVNGTILSTRVWLW